jgi:hypothetical protein
MFAQRLKPSAALRALKQALKLACSINGATAKRRPRCMETACLNLQAAQSNRQNRTLVQMAANGWKEPILQDAAHETDVRFAVGR